MHVLVNKEGKTAEALLYKVCFEASAQRLNYIGTSIHLIMIWFITTMPFSKWHIFTYYRKV